MDQSKWPWTPTGKALFWRFLRHYGWCFLGFLPLIVSMFVPRLLFPDPLAQRSTTELVLKLGCTFIPVTLFAASIIFGKLVQQRMAREVRCKKCRLCFHCGYDLCGLSDVGACPECNKPYDVKKAQAEWEILE